MLTAQQKTLLDFIRDRTKKDGVTPSYEEMQEELGLKSKSGIHRLVTGLEERGYIRRMARKARALEVVSGNRNTQSIPLYGRIAAGLPIEAQADDAEMIDVPVSLLGGLRAQGGKHYALTVKGDSMIEEGIMEDDIALIRETEVGEPGAIVVALVEDSDATLKRFERKKDRIILHPANADYKPQEYHASEVKVQGRLVGLLRRY